MKKQLNLDHPYQFINFHTQGDFTNLKGRLLTYIESLGFTTEREKSVKDMVSFLLEDFVSKNYFLIEKEDIEELWGIYKKSIKKIEQDYKNSTK